ncbi:MAG: hypothetical protein IKD40_00750 [Bacteroidaceae bacterium]|nr:hypothetical protein [Bacteroidaceae bacterium]
MKAGSAVSIATWTFRALMLITAVVLCMFYFVGYDNMSQVAAGMVTDPENLDLLMYWMYALLAICVLSVFIFTVIQFFSKLKDDPKSALKGLISLVLLAALFAVAYAVSDDAPVMNNGKAFTDTDILKMTDVCIYVQYVLLAVAALCTVLNLLGISKVLNRVKA